MYCFRTTRAIQLKSVALLSLTEHIEVNFRIPNIENATLHGLWRASCMTCYLYRRLQVLTEISVDMGGMRILRSAAWPSHQQSLGTASSLFKVARHISVIPLIWMGCGGYSKYILLQFWLLLLILLPLQHFFSFSTATRTGNISRLNYFNYIAAQSSWCTLHY